MSYLRRVLPVLIATASLFVATTKASLSLDATQSSSGPVVLLGIDGEDGGPSGHGPLENYVFLIDAMLAGEDEAGLPGVSSGSESEGLLILGGGKSPSDNVTTMWREVGAHADDEARDGAAGERVTFVNEPEAIREVDFGGHEIVVVVSSYYETASGGLTNEENEALSERAVSFADHINDGGGLLGLSQVGLQSRWDYLGDFALIESQERGYSDIDPTDEGRLLGIDDNLDVCCWHETFETFPDFLVALAYEAGTTNEAVVGGSAVRIPREDCDDLTDNDNDFLIDQADPDCQEDITGDAFYVALGDSYSSGEGNPPFETGTSEHGIFGIESLDRSVVNECHRSAQAWPRLVASQLFRGQVIFRACSGAVQDHVMESSQYSSEVGPQRNFVGIGVDVLTISIGGNDLDFEGFLRECVVGSQSCTERESEARRNIAALRPQLAANYRTLREAMSDQSRLIVVGYPNIFPDPDVVSLENCGDMDHPVYTDRGIDGPESKMLREVGTALEASLRLAANEAQVEFVPMWDAFAGHELCTADRWANDAPNKREALGHDLKFSFHPNASGHNAIASRVVAHLT